jgi:hypothetical protein
MSANAETALYANMRMDPTASSVQTRLVKAPCPLWVISGHVQRKRRCPLYTQ